jgi:hypothetical protein
MKDLEGCEPWPCLQLMFAGTYTYTYIYTDCSTYMQCTLTSYLVSSWLALSIELESQSDAYICSEFLPRAIRIFI